MSKCKIISDTKLLNQSKFSVWRIFNKSSLKDSNDSMNDLVIDDQEEITRQKKVINELQNKVEELIDNVKHLEHVSNSKERAIVALARDKERLAIELRKERRSSGHLKQQLEDERNFYMKEKETYCNEMNEFKKHKRKLLVNNKVQEENGKLKADLDEVLETNYNLCVKFLRMKHTKDDLKKRFERYQNDHAKILEDLAGKLDSARNELELIISEKFQKPISSKHKKILDVVKRNSQLIHENLSLKLQLEYTIDKLDRLKCSQTKLKYQSLKKETHSNSNSSEAQCGDFIIPLLNCSSIKMKSVTELSERLLKCSNYCTPQLSASSGKCSFNTKTQSSPAILNLKEFKQIKSIATQT